MKPSLTHSRHSGNTLRYALLIAACLLVPAASTHAARSPVLPPTSKLLGQSYAQWSAAWWQWGMELEVAGHPFTDDPDFDVTAGQSGSVWFLAGVVGPDPVVRTCTIPTGTALFVGLVNAEASDLEGLGVTEAEQREVANFFADHILDVFCTIDGTPVGSIDSYRVTSPQFSFVAPSPWIFGAVGGAGTAVADGYYVMIHPLSAGQHTIHFGGRFHFSVAEGDPFDLDAPVDMTYNVTVH